MLFEDIERHLKWLQAIRNEINQIDPSMLPEREP